MHKHLLVTLLAASLTAACSSTGPNLTREQAKKVKMCKANLPVAKKIATQSLTTGCLLSVALDKAIGSNNPAPAICLAGGTSGLLFGASIAERKCNYITLEDQLDGEIAHAVNMNSAFGIVFAQQEMELKKYQGSAAELAAQKASDEKAREAMADLEKTLSDQLVKDESLLTAARSEFRFKSETLQKSRQLKQKEKDAKLLKEIQALQKSIKLLQDNNNKLVRVKNSLTLSDS